MDDIIIPKHKEEIIETLHEKRGRRNPSSGGKKYTLSPRGIGVLIGCIVLLFILYYGLSIIERATVRITPHKETIQFKDTVIAVQATSSPKDTISFSVMTVEDMISGAVPATNKVRVIEKARGSIILYNTTTQAQKLSARTRMSTPSGSIYRLEQSVTIPARKTEAGKMIPGSVEAQVQATLPGAEYNGPASDLAIIGFKGSQKYTQIYGRSKSSFIGGFIGDRLVATNETITETRKQLRTSLADSLAKKALDSIPPGWIMYKDGTFIDVAEIQNDTAAQGTVTSQIQLTETGKLSAILVRADSLLRYVVNHKLADTSNTISYIAQGFENLSMTIVGKDKLILKNLSTFSMTLTGSVLLSADVSTESIKSDLLGIPVDQALSVFKKYSGVDKASVVLQPSFFEHIGLLRTLPGSKSNITVEIVTPE